MSGGSTHTLITPTVIAKEALMLLKNHLVMGNLVHRDYESEFSGGQGSSIRVRKPVKFTVHTGRTRNTTYRVTEQYITLTVATQMHVSWSFNTKDLTLSIEQYKERYLNNAVAKLANKVDADLLDLYKDVANSVWETTAFNLDPESFLVLGKAAQKIDEEGGPQDQRAVVLNPAANWSMANAMRNMYVTRVSEKALTKGYLTTIANFDVYMDQNVKTHTTGFMLTDSSASDKTGVEVGTTQPCTGSETTAIQLCDFDIITSHVLREGDVFTIAGVYAVNPMSGDSTGSLRQFVVTADVSCGSAGTTTEVPLTVYISPEIRDTGPYKTVDTLPADGAAVDIIGHEEEPYPQSLAFHKNAFALIFVPLEMPDGAAFKARETDPDSGLSIRVIKDYDIDVDDEVIRLDILYGVKTLYPELACRIWGKQG
jgi:hypothetical protein